MNYIIISRMLSDSLSHLMIIADASLPASSFSNKKQIAVLIFDSAMQSDANKVDSGAV
jgi:hypothetical protein